MQRKNTGNRNRGGGQQQQRSQPSESSSSSSPNLLTAALGIASGVAIGAGVMYLLDPNQGAERRHQLAQKASDTAQTAWDAVSEHAADAGERLSDAFPAAGEKLKKQFGHASDTADDARSAASGWMRSARARLSDKVDQLNPFERHTIAPAAVAATSAGLAALAIGASAMWLFDPDRGRARRAWIGQKLQRTVNETGQFMRATGRHLANKGQGYYYETRSAAEGAMDTAMSKLGGASGQSQPQGESAVPSI